MRDSRAAKPFPRAEDDPYFTPCGVCAGRREEASEQARQAIVKVLRKEWEMSTSELRQESGVKDRAAFTARWMNSRPP